MTQRNQSLDLLRGAAVLLVVASHCASGATGAVAGLTALAMDYGQLGVQLFFIVSGYTMMLTFGDKIDSAAVRSFYVRRVFRIVPPFWIAIVFYLLLTGGEGFRIWAAPNGVSAGDVVLTFLFLHWSSVTAFNSVVPGGWSIGVEMQFYLLFPLLIQLFRRSNGPLLVYGLIALTSVVGHFAADHYLIPRLPQSLPRGVAQLTEAFYYCWLPRQAICFGFGILLYDLVELKNRPKLGALLLLGASLFTAWGAQVALLFALAYAILATSATLSILGLLGRHSYAIYLVHFAVVAAITTLFPLGFVPLFVLASAVSLALSYYLIEPLIERRFNRLGHGLASQLGPPKAAVTNA